MKSVRIITFLVILVLAITSCGLKKPDIQGFRGFTQGTTYSILYDNNRNITPDELREKVEKVLHNFDMSLSNYNDSSVISRMNRNEFVVSDRYFTEVFEKSLRIWKMTGGAFDITVAPLVTAWGFGPDAHKNFSESKRDSLMKLVGMQKISLKDGRLVKSNPAIKLDVNAIAQGYSVDVVCSLFDELGIKNYLIEIGGEVRAKGTKGGDLWKIGIDKPVDNNMSPGENLQAVIRIGDKALSTSGNYRKFYVENGIKYSHTIDPHTGNPAKNTLLSATIIADDCSTADGIATACMVMGKDASIEFINQHHELAAYLVYSDDAGNFLTWSSDRLKDLISERDNE